MIESKENYLHQDPGASHVAYTAQFLWYGSFDDLEHTENMLIIDMIDESLKYVRVHIES